MYSLSYDPITGKVGAIMKGRDCIPLDECNIDYQDFLKWNQAQATPLDLNSISTAMVTAQTARETKQAQRAQAIIDNLPSRTAMRTAINNANTVPKLQAIVLKMGEVLYWLAKDRAD